MEIIINILILGLGITGQAVIKFYNKFYPEYNLWIYDSRDLSCSNSLPKYQFNKDIFIDKIIISAGIYQDDKKINQVISDVNNINDNVVIESELDVFFCHVKKPVIAITGTNGKSSVCRLLYELLTCAGHKVLLGGNYGPAALSLLCSANNLDQIDQTIDYYVLEVSSFQLAKSINFRSYIGCVLNITPDHLDYHRDMLSYIQAKSKILLNTNYAIAPDLAIDNHYKILDQRNNNLNYLNSIKSRQDFSANINLIKLIAEILHIPDNVFNKIINNIDNYNLPHRFEIINSGKITWVNDSKATNISSTKVALVKAASLANNKIILILGGKTKGQDFKLLYDFIIQHETPIRAVCLIGEDGLIKDNLFKLFSGLFTDKFSDNSDNSDNRVIRLSNMLDTVLLCSSMAMAGDVVLLSPSCSSLDQYKDFAQRGDEFKRIISGLCQKILA